MKKTTLILIGLFVSFMATGAYAQHQVGVIGGLNVADLNIKDAEENFDTRSVFGLGGVLDFALQKNISLRFEPMYLQKGGTQTGVDPDVGNVEAKWKLDYLEVPVFLKVGISTSSVRPYVMAGPTIGILLNSKLGGSIGPINIDVDAKDITKSTDFGLGFGAGVSLPFGANALFVEGRYVLGLTDILDDGTLDIMDEQEQITGDVKTRGIQFMAGMTFPLGK